LPAVSFAYIPWGPTLPAAVFWPLPAEGPVLAEGPVPGEGPGDEGQTTAALRELAGALRPLLPADVAFVRFDPPWFTRGKDVAGPTLGKPFLPAPAPVQPPDTVLVDLQAAPDAILAQMKSKWRYNIRLGEKKCAVFQAPVSDGADDGLGDFYALLQETAARDGIAVHGQDYYRTLFRTAQDFPGVDLRLYLAVVADATGDGDHARPIAGIITLFCGTAAVYLYGASSSAQRNLMAPQALQWRAMQDAKTAGCEVYDLFGIPPNGDPGHPMHGLYLFKTGFGGVEIHRPGSWDYVYRTIPAKLFRLAEALRKKLRDRKKHKTNSTRTGITDHESSLSPEQAHKNG
jgi:hypothetical protein